MTPRNLWIIFVSSLVIIAIVSFMLIFDVWGVSFRRGDDDDDDGDDDEDDEESNKD